MLTWTPFELHTAQPFGIARWTHSAYERVRVDWSLDGVTGRGEAAPNAFYGETGATVPAALERLMGAAGDPWEFRTLAGRLDAALGHHPSAKCALEMAAVEVCALLVGRPVRDLLGLPGGEVPESSLTIGLASLSEMAAQAQAAVARGHGILKVKLGTPQDEAILAALRDVAPEVTLRVDANAAWSLSRARRMLDVLADYRVELLEQPLPAGDLAGHAALRRSARLPIIADESLHSVASVPALAEAFDGVNLKLAKLGGPVQGLRALELARLHGLEVMVGCMIESSLGIAAAAMLAPLCDWVDLDSPLLLAAEPVSGLEWKAGRLQLPPGPGWGVAWAE
ncbi:Mandelate racemase/muconate lactonizing protein [Deinococcus proteolyticus MRP]|uniref:Dipeptide epimerase n=1 Tax=Deinococcus proteolyticus (strain ATCC 35074 / DSM 20540 / JCM 6276 / NBRC 101906 / NCIMB 13154 / VKM Ac-1939 / CCM 2703 / MRP) TaxID=693977 RepID=F0RMW5_DEIPM|nr:MULTISPECIES: dipeptide epimerase [Deinococcus]ADY26107.1 Mandelate racemase/muconate lactonizing protein [Deinococcus proteolyticus MRP]MCY1702227.1 dipeptide epimerase [Deinococcus sp. SL84]